jgi:hypothetical protein
MEIQSACKPGQVWQLVRMRGLLLMMFLLGFGLFLPGCKGDCRQLSEKLCECEEYKPARDYCRQRAADKESLYPPTAAENAQCKLLLEGCDCKRIDTPEGKAACGLARP